MSKLKKSSLVSASDKATTTKISILEAALAAKDGATINDLATLTGWQKLSVRGALACALKRKGLKIVSAKTDGVRRYRIEATA